MTARAAPVIRFHTERGAVTATVSQDAPDRSRPGARIRVDVDVDTLDAAYAAGAFDLERMFPGGDVPGIEPGRPVTLELRLAAEYAEMLAASSREPGMLVGDLVGLTETNPIHLLLDATAWWVTAVVQDTGLHLTTLHDSAAEPPDHG